MGCDIHAFLEYRKQYTNLNGVTQWDKWDTFSGELHFCRNYGMFAAMSGTRKYMAGVKSFEPKGIPPDIAYATLDAYTLLVLDDEWLVGQEGHTSPENAENYAKDNGWWGADHKRVIHPDWHTPSWLSSSELQTAYGYYRNYYRDYEEPMITPKMTIAEKGAEMERVSVKGPVLPIPPSPFVEALLATMQSLESNGYETRLVFWYDN